MAHIPWQCTGRPGAIRHTRRLRTSKTHPSGARKSCLECTLCWNLAVRRGRTFTCRSSRARWPSPCSLGVEVRVVGQYPPAARGHSPSTLTSAGVVIPKELHGVVVLASSSVAIAHRDELPSTRVEPAALAPPEKSRPSGNPDFGENGSKNHT
jgi:hypothetical protein